MTEAEQMARGLTEVQRAALLDAWPISGPGTGAFIRTDSDDLFESLEDEGLIQWTGLLTPLGLAVRHHLTDVNKK